MNRLLTIPFFCTLLFPFVVVAWLGYNEFYAYYGDWSFEQWEK